MKNWHLTWIIPLCLVISFIIFCIGATEEHNNRVPLEIYKYQIQSHWACMEGCSNMQESLFEYNYYNQTMKKLHDDCADICYKQYMVDINDS